MAESDGWRSSLARLIEERTGIVVHPPQIDQARAALDACRLQMGAVSLDAFVERLGAKENHPLLESVINGKSCSTRIAAPIKVCARYAVLPSVPTWAVNW